MLKTGFLVFFFQNYCLKSQIILTKVTHCNSQGEPHQLLFIFFLLKSSIAEIFTHGGSSHSATEQHQQSVFHYRQPETCICLHNSQNPSCTATSWCWLYIRAVLYVIITESVTKSVLTTTLAAPKNVFYTQTLQK